MTGSFSIEVKNSDVCYKFVINRNITVLRGEGATGKTLLYDLVNTYNNADKRGITVNTTRGAIIETLDNQRFRDNTLLQRLNQNRIFIVDEDSTFVNSNEFAVQAIQSGFYFILINRDRLDQLSCSIHEIYQLKTSYDRVVTFERLYPVTHYGAMSPTDSIITEDQGAGRQFFSRVFPLATVTGAHGRDDIINKLRKAKQHTLVVADGAAFGFNMPEVYSAVSSCEGALILLESFEYAILKSGIVHSKDVRLDTLDSPEVQSTVYSSWEQYYTDLLIDLTKDSVLAYKKTHLQPEYSKTSNASKILEVYDLPPIQPDISSTCATNRSNVFSDSVINSDH